MGKTNGALPPHQDPYFVPQNGDFMIARLVIIIALQGRLLVTEFFASKKKRKKIRSHHPMLCYRSPQLVEYEIPY